jgi:Domain of unknown function (DUF4331)
MKDVRSALALLMATLLAAPVTAFGASHREAPITALDHAADITDYYSFVSYEDPTKVVFIMNVDPLLEPSNGPNYFPFDPNVLYAIHIDNSYDALEDISFEIRFTTKVNAPGLFTGFVGAGTGVNAPANAPYSLGAGPGQAGPTAGTAVIPPQITALKGAGAAGLSLQQTYTVGIACGSGTKVTRADLTGGQTLVAVPTYVGARTMGTPAQYNALAKTGIYSLSGQTCTANGPAPVGPGQNPLNMRVFAGTVDDPFYIDLGATFDSLNYRSSAFFGGGVPILAATQDAIDNQNFAPDAVAGFNVNTIAIEVPIAMLQGPSAPVIGSWATTSRLKTQVRPPASGGSAPGPDAFTQVQRMGNALINEVIIGTGSKDTWSITAPYQDAQFAPFALDPLLPRALNAVFGIPVPDPPRMDLLPLVVYAPPIVAAGAAPTPITPANPVADLLRLNYSIPPTPQASRKRLGFIAGDSAGYPNGRRVTDDVTDISLRAVAGLLCSSCTTQGLPFKASQVPLLGDGVNTNEIPTQEVFPYVAFAHSGRDSSHNSSCAPNCPQ